MERLLFLPSTPLNVLVSSALAIQWQSEFEMELWLIDQKKVFDNPYYQALLNWKDTPFEQVQVFAGNARGRAKIKERQENFEKLRLSVDRFEPDKIAVGSDRRIEFQYLLHYLRQKGKEVKGLYLDDGLYSYSGRKPHFFKDSLNAWLKKLAYGRWWEEPSTVGASSLIDEAWLFQPSLVVKALSEKPCFKLQADWFKSPSLTGLSDALAQTLNVDTQGVAKLDVLILIPHPNNIKKIHGYEKRIKALVGELSRKGKKVGVKYHPRMQQEDALGLKEYGASEVLSTQMAFEFYLPMLSSYCEVIGDVGSALLTTKWLRPDIGVKAVLDENEGFQRDFIPLIQAMQIQLLSDYSELVNG